MYVKGVGPNRGALLAGKGLVTVEDLLSYPPFRYEDRSNVKPIIQLAPGEMATVIAEVRSVKMSNVRQRLPIFEASFSDNSRGVLLAKWFRGDYLKNVLVPGLRVALFGKVELDSFRGDLQIMHPEFEILSDNEEDFDATLHVGRIVPIYEAAGKVNARQIRTLIRRILDELPPQPDPLPESIRLPLKLPDYWTAIQQLHFPAPGDDLKLLNAFRSPAQFRLVCE